MVCPITIMGVPRGCTGGTLHAASMIMNVSSHSQTKDTADATHLAGWRRYSRRVCALGQASPAQHTCLERMNLLCTTHRGPAAAAGGGQRGGHVFL
jgi:hypothetical protein